MVAGRNSQRKLPILSRQLRRLLGLVFFLFALLAVNSLYLSAITLLETGSGEIYQDYFYLLMFLLHLLLGLLLILPFILFGLLHARRAVHHPNRYAIRAGLGLLVSGLLLLLSGLILTRFGFFEINDPEVRRVVYWIHVLSPVLAAWLFVVHRLAGPRIRWRVGGYWATTAILVAGIMSVLQIESRDFYQLGDDFPYAPAFVRIDGEQTQIPEQHLMQDEVCAECHEDIARQTAMSMHRFSSFNNPAYRFSIDEARAVLLERDKEVKVARLCAACHDQVPLFSGQFDDPGYQPDEDSGAQAGITCIGCHAITAINSPRGNGSYDFQDPPRYPFAFSGNTFLQAVNRQLIKAKSVFHKATFLKPIHQTPEFCSACHKVHLPYELNQYKWLRGQNHYDSFLLSGVSGHRVDSFYYPDQAVPNCATCHMPLVPSDDPAARALSDRGERSVHNHLFAAANTGVPHLLDQPEWSNEQREDFLLRAARVDIFGLKEGDIDGQLHAPLRPQLPDLEPGRPYLLELVVRTLGVGHQLTQGTTDSNELWLELTMQSGDRVIGRSGAMNAAGEVDPWSYFVNSYLLDREGKRIERRDAHNIFVALYDHQIPPGAAATVHYALEVPPDVTGPVTIEAKLQYRKFDSRFLRHVLGEAFERNDLPVVTLAADRITLPLAGMDGATSDQNNDISPWERWNDYGIGLLRKGKRELRQAEAAFEQVERLAPAHGALNLARVHFREGRLEAATTDLKRAANAGAPPWTLSWYSALVDREFGNLDQAIVSLQALIETQFQEAVQRGFDFSKDYRVLNEMGRTLFERARQERGERRFSQRRQYLQQAREWLEKVLELDPENVKTHYNLALVFTELGDTDAAAEHRLLHDKYRPDDQAIEQAVTAHRSRNPAANHAAEETAVYNLQREGAYGLVDPAQIASFSRKYLQEASKQ